MGFGPLDVAIPLVAGAAVWWLGSSAGISDTWLAIILLLLPGLLAVARCA